MPFSARHIGYQLGKAAENQNLEEINADNISRKKTNLELPILKFIETSPSERNFCIFFCFNPKNVQVETLITIQLNGFVQANVT